MLDFFRKRPHDTIVQPEQTDKLSSLDAEMIEYAVRFEHVLSNMESHFRKNSLDYRDVGINMLRMFCDFHQGDWAGILFADLDYAIWKPHWWYNPGCKDRTNELVEGFQSSVGLERWIQCVRDREVLVLKDVETIKDTYPEEYNLYKRLQIHSLLAAPLIQNPTGFLVVRNPQKFIHQTSFLKMVPYVVGGAICEDQRAESQKMMVTPECIKNPNEIVIKLFGNLEIYTAKGAIFEEQIRSPKLCKLLVYLLLSKKTLHQPLAIADALWPNEERDSEKICSNIRGLVYRFRKPFQLISDEDLIISTQAGYRLNPKLKIKTDYDQFDTLEREACHATEKMRRIELMKQAITLYRGEFFASTNSEDWVQSTARSFALRYIHLVNEILSILAEVGDIAGVHYYARKGIEFTPENVKAHFWMIHAVRCGMAPELFEAELKWSKERLTEEEYQDLLELLEKTKKPDMKLSVEL